MAGPICGRMLADLGADVVKVEPPGPGDPTRAFAPAEADGTAAAFVMANRNKRGAVIDLKSEPGREVARRMLARCDVVIENFRAGVMERLGLSYETLRVANPGLVYCQITGFGRTGPLAEHRGFDLIAQGMTGLLSVTGEGPGRPPVKCGPPLTDITAGILAAMGVVTALYAREKTGVGQRVDTSLYEAGLTQTFWQAAVALATGESPGPAGLSPPPGSPVRGPPDGRRLDHGGRLEPGELAPPGGGDGSGRARLRSPFRDEHGPHDESWGAARTVGGAAEGGVHQGLAEAPGEGGGAGRTGVHHDRGAPPSPDRRPRHGGHRAAGRRDCRDAGHAGEDVGCAGFC